MFKNHSIKLAALLLAGSLTTACAASAPTATTTPSSAAATTSSSPSTTAAATDSATTTVQTASSSADDAQGQTALALLASIWQDYEEAEQFPAGGGDPAHNVMGAPGAFSLEDPALTDNALGLPADDAALVSDAASLVHMMNANTFTAGAYHIQAGEDLDALAQRLRENIQSRQWMCGFPEKLVILSTEDHLIAAFGHGEFIDFFTDKARTFANMDLLVEEPIQ